MIAPVPIAILEVGVRQWLNTIRDGVSLSAEVVGSFAVTAQTATYVAALTPNTAPNKAAGVYRVSVQAHVSVAASVSSSLSIAVAWTDGGASVSKASSGISGNVLTENDGLIWLVRADAGTPITVTVTYGSVGTAMQFGADAFLEAMPGALG